MNGEVSETSEYITASSLFPGEPVPNVEGLSIIYTTSSTAFLVWEKPFAANAATRFNITYFQSKFLDGTSQPSSSDIIDVSVSPELVTLDDPQVALLSATIENLKFGENYVFFVKAISRKGVTASRPVNAVIGDPAICTSFNPTAIIETTDMSTISVLNTVHHNTALGTIELAESYLEDNSDLSEIFTTSSSGTKAEALWVNRLGARQVVWGQNSSPIHWISKENAFDDILTNPGNTSFTITGEETQFFLKGGSDLNE